ncbi:hypothetical protein P4472_02960 [Bacillus subtilis]|nr:hypothetical protein [Bacillus subtilis]MED3694158.1 hypothetical protein [Bacillus subtilis]
MEALTITLRIDGKDKKFVTPDFISGKFFRTAAAIAEDFESNDDERLFTENKMNLSVIYSEINLRLMNLKTGLILV